MNGIADYLSGKNIIIIAGHYGAGKTNLAVNLSVELRCTLVDLDIVNPYFRSADSKAELQKLGIECIAPEFANSNLDIPALPAGINSIFAGETKRAVIDVGGDGGSVALGGFADKIRRERFEMIYVVNKYRPLIGSAESAAELAKHIERKSKLKITALINNSNIGGLTTEKEALGSMEYAFKTAELLDVPLLGTTFMGNVDFCEKKEYNILRIKNYTKKLF